MRFVLGGSVLASGQDVRVTAQLVDSKTGAQLWNETFKGDLSNLFGLQDQVTAARRQQHRRAHGDRRRARERDTKSAPQVVDLMLRARALSFRPHSIENFRERERLYREALSQEPNNVNAMVCLASTLAIHSPMAGRLGPGQGQAAHGCKRPGAPGQGDRPGSSRDRASALPLRHGAQRFRWCAPCPRGGARQGPEGPVGLQQLRTLSSEHGRAGACNSAAQASLVPVSQGQRVHFRQPWHGVPGIGEQRCRDRMAAQGGRPEHGDLGHVLGARHGVLQQGRHGKARHVTLPSIRNGRPRKASRGSKAMLRHRGVRRPT